MGFREAGLWRLSAWWHHQSDRGALSGTSCWSWVSAAALHYIHQHQLGGNIHLCAARRNSHGFGKAVVAFTLETRISFSLSCFQISFFFFFCLEWVRFLHRNWSASEGLVSVVLRRHCVPGFVKRIVINHGETWRPKLAWLHKNDRTPLLDRVGPTTR